MQIVLPTIIQKCESIFPKKLFEANGITIVIEKFSIEDKQELFKIEGLTVNQDKIDLKTAKDPKVLIDYPEYICGGYKIIIEKQTTNASELQKIQGILDFIFRIIMGSGFPIGKFVKINDSDLGGIFYTNKRIISKRKNIILTIDKISRIKNLLKILISQMELKRIDTMKFFLETAMSQVPNTGIAGAFYITILENIFLPKQVSELQYRFSMRITKYRKEKWEYKEKMKNLYDKRSKIFHGTGDKFTIEDLIFLENETCWALEEFIKDQMKFTDENLDKILID